MWLIGFMIWVVSLVCGLSLISGSIRIMFLVPTGFMILGAVIMLNA